MSAGATPQQTALLDVIRRELDRPDLSLEDALEIPVARLLLQSLTSVPPSADSAREQVAAPSRSPPLARFTMSRVVVRAAIEDSFDIAALEPDDREREALLAASDIIMIDGHRRLRLADRPRAEFLDVAIGTEVYESLLKRAVADDMKDHEAIGKDPIRLPSAWLRCFLSGVYTALHAAPPGELKAALCARRRLRFVRRLEPKIPSIEDVARRVELAEVLEPLRLLIGAQGGWDGTPPIDRFVGREKELRRLRAFVDELMSHSWSEAVSRFAKRTAREFTGAEPPGLIMVEGAGGLGKSTLLAKFVLDHALAQSRPFPFAYLDFDRASIDPERPRQLLLEIAQQVALQYPTAQPRLQKLCNSIRAELIRRSKDAVAPTGTGISDPVSAFVETVRENATFHGDRAFLLVLDTLEVVQWNPRAVTGLTTLIEEFRTKGLDELRVVASGRADVPELQRISGVRVATPSIEMKAMRVSEANEMAQTLGATALGSPWKRAWSAAIAGTADQDEQRREPLAVRIAVDLIARSEPGKREQLAKEIAEAGLEAGDDFVAVLYERRILNHIRDKNAEKLAWPGLVVRRVTREITRELLAAFCGIAAEDADKAFTALGHEVWMVTREGDALRHRPDLRARTLPLMRRKDRARFDAMVSAAVQYFAERRHRSTEDHVEWIYHRLLAGEPPRAVDPDMTPELLPLLARAEADFPRGSAAGSYLAARTVGKRMSPSQIRELSAWDALYHLRATAESAFGLDDLSVDPVVLDLAERLHAEPLPMDDDLHPWARTLWIKTGAWRHLAGMLETSEGLSAQVRLARIFWSARIFQMVGEPERERLVEQEMRSLASVSPGRSRNEFRTMVEAMALARVAGAGAFAELDEKVAQLLSRMRINLLPSTQAALRTAVVFGELSRGPAVYGWLAARRRGTGERVRNPSISRAELFGLFRMRPGASDLGAALDRQWSDSPSCFQDEQTLTASAQIIEDIVTVAENDDQEPTWRALSRIFASRCEDWVVPLGYAAARAYARPLAVALLQRLKDYWGGATERRAEVERDMIGAMRLADEAGDLPRFAKLVLAECEPHAPATTELRFLLDCLAAWQHSIDAIVGTAPITAVEEWHVPASEPPPPPAPVKYRHDPQKERWGGLATRDGRVARAILESVERNVFYFSVSVESTDGSKLEPPVIFHLHDSYPRSRITLRRTSGNRQALLSGWNAYGVFTIGVQVKRADGSWISLEIDLAELPGLPPRFRDR